MVLKQEDRRKRIYNFYYFNIYIENRKFGKTFTVEHYLAEGVPKRTTYSIIQRVENDEGHERIKGSGRVAKKMTQKRSIP